MAFAHHLHDPCPHCPCGCAYFQDQFPGSTLSAHWSVDRGSASIAGAKLSLAANSAASCDVLSTDGTPYGAVLAAVNFPAGSAADAAVRLLTNYTDPDNYAFVEYRGDGTVHLGTRAGGTDTSGGTWFQADIPVLGPLWGGRTLTTPLPLQLCYRPDRIMGTAQYSPDGFDANLVGAGMSATIGSSKCGIATNAAATLGVIFKNFSLNLGADKNNSCAGCAPACGQWQYSDIDAVLSYHGLCNAAPGQFVLDLGGGLSAGVTGPYPPGPCSGCSHVAGEFTLEYCPWDASGADHDPAPWGNGQCYPGHPVPPTYYGEPSAPGGQCKWCYYGDTALCENDTLFQCGVGIWPATVGGVTTGGYFFQADLYISSLPIPNIYSSTVYNQDLWQAHYQSAVFPVSSNPNCTDPFAASEDGSITLNLSGKTILPWFGGQICGDPPATITLKMN
jgi:hypothetical protein